jgi:hypothetical protein
MAALEVFLAIMAVLGSVASSIWGIKSVMKHESEMCDKRLEAFKEGLIHGEENR